MSIFLLKVRAFGIHFLGTLFVAIISAACLFFVWYPDGISHSLRGAGLYKLVLLTELILGPCMSLVIYSPRKKRGELVRDYTVIFVIQLAAFLYGINTARMARPIYMVFAVDRIEPVSLADLDIGDLSELRDDRLVVREWQKFKWVCIREPDSEAEKSEILWAALSGKDVHLRTYYYRACDANEVYRNSHKITDNLGERLTNIVDENRQSDTNRDGFRWLPFMSRFGDYVVVVDKNQNIRQIIEYDGFQ